MLQIFWTKIAREDLKNIREFIAYDSIYYANKFIEELISSTDKLKTFSKSGRIVPEIRKDNVREIIYGSYRIMYEIRENKIYIMQIVHGAKDFKK